MARAEPDACSAYISGASMNFFNYAAAGLPADAIIAASGNSSAFADSVAPFWCDIINGFITPITGAWTAIIEGATTIIEAIRKALSNPKKIQVAIRKIVALITSIIEKIQEIIVFLTEIPDKVEEFVLGQINKAKQSLVQYVNTLQTRAEAICIAKKNEILLKLSEKLENTSDPAKRARISASMSDIFNKSCDDLVTLGISDGFEWPAFPELVFNLGILIESVINSINIPLPSINLRLKFWDDTDRVQTGVIDSKIEAAAAWSNAKVDSVNEFIKPFVASYNTIMEFLTILSKFSLKGILKWLISLPAKIIKVHIGAIQFAIDFLAGIALGNPLQAIETWASAKFEDLATKIKENADQYDTSGIEKRANFVRDFIKEIMDLVLAAKDGITALRTHIEERAAAIGAVFGSILEVAAQFYGFLQGGVTYAINVITAGAVPLLALIGFAAEMFAPPTNQSPDPDNPQTREPVAADNEYETIIQDGVPYGYFLASNGVQVFDDEGLPTRINQGDDESLLLPLLDPNIDLNAPDITLWTKIGNETTHIVPMEVEQGAILENPIANSITTIREGLEFFEFPSMTEITEGIVIPNPGVSELNSVDPAATKEEYQGTFKYVRKYTYIEEILTNTNEFMSKFGRNPVLDMVRSNIEIATGKYNYSVLGDSLTLSVDSSVWLGNNISTAHGLSESEIERVFIPGIIGAKLYLENDVYRLGLISNNNNVGLQPTDDYSFASTERYRLSDSDNPFAVLNGGVLFNIVAPLLRVVESSSGVVSMTTSLDVNEGHLYVRYEDEDYTRHPFVYINTSKSWLVSFGPIPSPSGVYYCDFGINGVSGYYYREDTPQTLTF